MSILNIDRTLPVGFTGDPYVAVNVDIFSDMNWPGWSGIQSQGLGLRGLRGLSGCGDCLAYDDNGNCTSIDTASCDSTTSGSLIASTLNNPGLIDLPTAPTIDTSSAGSGVIAGAPNQSSYTPAQLAAIVAAGGSSAVSIIRTAEGGPYTVAGTNLVYNPATGQLSSSIGANVSSVVSSLSAYAPLIGIAIAAIILLPMITGRK